VTGPASRVPDVASSPRMATVIRSITAQLTGAVAAAATARVAELVLGTSEQRALRRIVRESATAAVGEYPEIAAISAEIDLLSDADVADELLVATVPGTRPDWKVATARWSRLYGQRPDARALAFLGALAAQMRPRLQRSRVLQGLWIALAVERQSERLDRLGR
jgi:hypothetical protein